MCLVSDKYILCCVMRKIMPYIKDSQKVKLHNGQIPKDAGELNYWLTVQIKAYIEKKGESYQTYNDVLGVLSAMPQELYRRKIAPYEDIKIKKVLDCDCSRQDGYTPLVVAELVKALGGNVHSV